MSEARFEIQDGGVGARITLDAGRGNVVTCAVADGLRAAFERAFAARETRFVVLDAAGDHFSFGASVEEHRPAEVGRMLATFHQLILAVLEAPVPVLAAVRGKCLGGGYELALATTRIFAHPGAEIGQPEIRLGVFAPAASALLPMRVAQPVADELLVTGRTIKGAEALARGLVDVLCAPEEDPTAAALAYARAHLSPLSPTSLRIAVRASRQDSVARAAGTLRRLERMYLDELAPTPDAREGIDAFLAKRPPRWTAVAAAR